VSSFRDSVVLWVDRRVQESAQVHLPNDDPPLCEAIDVLTENTLVEKLFRMLSAIKKLLKTREWVLLVWFAKLCGVYAMSGMAGRSFVRSGIFYIVTICPLKVNFSARFPLTIGHKTQVTRACGVLGWR